jgi:hypothetical protein
MLHPEIARLAATQYDLFARWQLLRAGVTPSAARHHCTGLRRMHSGVFLLGGREPDAWQRWMAATLTAPCTYLGLASAAACWGWRPHRGGFETVTRPGKGGPRQLPRQRPTLLLTRSATLDGHVTVHRGVPITTVERTLLDLSPHLDDRARRKAFREALRLRLTTAPAVRAVASAAPVPRGGLALAGLADLYVRLPIARCRSDAEAMGLEVLELAGRPIPEVNVIIARKEADFTWREHRLIIEIDGPGFHVLTDEDARKTAIWRAAGYTVLRIGSDDVFDRPERLLAMAPVR